jgi:hypothetical protein
MAKKLTEVKVAITADAAKKLPILTPGLKFEDVIDIVRLSDIYRRNGKFGAEEGHGYGQYIARQFIRLGADFAGAVQTINDPQYKSNNPHWHAQMHAIGVSISALANSCFQRQPDMVILPVSQQCDHRGTMQRILDGARTARRKSNFRMVLQAKPYAPDQEVFKHLGHPINVLEQETAFAFKMVDLALV